VTTGSEEHNCRFALFIFQVSHHEVEYSACGASATC
jgi:hypothetical protein